MPLVTKRRLIAAKIETTEGTAEALANADADILAMDPKISPDFKNFERKNVSASLSRFPSVTGSRTGKLTFKVEIKGSGAAGTAPSHGKLLRACGRAETVVPATSVSYAYASASIPSITLGLYNDGIAYKLAGARGSAKVVEKVGEVGYYEFTFTGKWVDPTDVALLTQTLEATVPVAFTGAAFTVHSYAAQIGSLTVDDDNKLAVRDDPSEATGVKSVLLTERNTKGDMDPEATLVATMDWFGKWKSGTLATLTWAHTGAAGNIVTFTATKCQFTSIDDDDRDGIAAYKLGFQLNRTSGDDELSIVYT